MKLPRGAGFARAGPWRILWVVLIVAVFSAIQWSHRGRGEAVAMSACTDANVDLWYQQAFSLDDKLRTSNAPPRAFTSEAYGLERAPACSSSTIKLSREESAKYADVLLVGSADGALVYLDTKNYVQARKRVDAYFQTARFAKPTMEAGWDVPSRARQLAPIMQRINALLAAKGYPPKPYIPDRA